MAEFANRFSAMISGLSMVRKLSMVIVLGASLAGVGYLVHASKQTSLEPLFTNLTSEDMGQILTQLDKQGVRYDVDQDHRTISVPGADVLDIRLKLAGQGLPRFGGVGFELFDKGGFGMSEFEQKVNFQRALEGELSRTIGGIKEVESARVHLVLPEKTLFAEAQANASASVIVKLGNNASLSREKVNSITHLVASAVDSLAAEQVTVVDTTGRLLTQGGGDPSIVAGGQIFDQKMQIERSFERRIVELLSPVVGFGKVVARVTADMDFTRTESTDEIVDPTKSAIISESRSNMKKTESAASAGGVSGAAANLAGGGAGGSGGSSGSSDEGTENIAYQVSKTIRKQVVPMGAIKNMSVAILVDGTYTGEGDQRAYQARAPEELTKIEDLVKKTIGFSADRGDQIKIENLAFQNPEAEMADAAQWYEKKTTYGFLLSIIGNVLLVVAILLVFFFVIRPLMKGWSGARGGAMLGANGTPLLEGEVSGNITQMVRADPQAAANAIRQWLK